MTLRNRFLITAALLCHLLLVPPLVTSQLPPSNSSSTKGSAASAGKSPTLPNTPCARAFAESSNNRPTICAIQQERDGDVYKLHGAVEIYYETYVLKSDEATFDADTNEATASGHFSLDGGPNDDHIRADHGTYNFALETGKFYDVTGTTGLRFRANRVILTSAAPFAFTGKLVEKTSQDHYLVYDGTITTCELPHPNWQFDARKVSVDVGGNAKIYRSTFDLHGIPILWLPYATHPVEKESRQSGFLMPSVGHSSTNGYMVGDAYYWAINRMMDATVGGEYFSLRGGSQRGEFRVRPSETSYADLNYFGVIDRGIGSPPLKEGGENARLNAAANIDGFRGVTNIDYLSSFLFRLAFNEVFSQAVYSEVKSQAFLSKSTDGYSINGFAERYQNFLSTTPGQVITILHTPSADLSGVDHQLWRTPLYWSFDASGTGLSRSEPAECSTVGSVQSCTPAFRTANLLGRFDLNPELSLPLLFRGWSLRPELTLHETYYTQRLIGESGTNPGQAVSDPIDRHAVETAVELRPPALERVFDKQFLGRKWKHVIEPRAVYRFVTGVNNYSNVVKFDERDILTDTHEVEYGFVTRLYAKRTSNQPEDCSKIMTALTVGGAAPESSIPWQHTNPLAGPGCQAGPPVRELVTWELAQKYFLDPTFGGALVPGQRNVFTTTIDLTGIAFLTQPRHLSPLVSRLRVETSARTDVEWDMDFDFQNNRVNASTLLANYHIGQVTIGGGDAILEIPGQTAAASSNLADVARFNQFRAAVGYGSAIKRGFSAAGSFGFDADLSQLQFVSAQATYNWNCCGMTLEYRTYTVANVRNENLFLFNFSLANIGSFGSLRQLGRLY
ncbi:MAG TPA: LPS assembly protein LptD [Candidatus Deferrimicrobiaceae bacterium]|jgi:LPS-assembly protein|nr:LPS assembly protein LptD [Candidatus Deferrimicrobiaceae bacterium]